MPPLVETSTMSYNNDSECNSSDNEHDEVHSIPNQSLHLLNQVAKELEWMKQQNSDRNHGLHRFPPACYRMVISLPGNDACMDCGARGGTVDWASTSFGALLCLPCSGKHRSLGVKVSKVQSLTLDHWSQEQIMAMLEGGNQQLYKFFHRHQLTTCDHSQGHHHHRQQPQPQLYNTKSHQEHIIRRYRTKCAKFYRDHLILHAQRVANSCGLYQGREASRTVSASCSRR